MSAMFTMCVICQCNCVSADVKTIFVPNVNAQLQAGWALFFPCSNSVENSSCSQDSTQNKIQLVSIMRHHFNIQKHYPLSRFLRLYRMQQATKQTARNLRSCRCHRFDATANKCLMSPINFSMRERLAV